jgi:replicative DNA helicase
LISAIQASLAFAGTFRAYGAAHWLDTLARWSNGAVDHLRALSDVLAEADAHLSSGEAAAPAPWPTGFPPLDGFLAGGLRAGELTLLGGPQGLGKTAFVLQVLRNTVSRGGAGVYFSYEHDAATVLQRLIGLEAALTNGVGAPSLRTIREAMEASSAQPGTLADRLAAVGGSEAVRRVADYGRRLLVHRSTGSTTDVAAIRDVAQEVVERTGITPLVVVDYLQKVAVPDASATELDNVTVIVEGLKDFALESDLPVLAVVAADKEGLVAGKRLRMHHLRGSSALAYEPDIVLIMNEKFDVVARHHLVYDLGNAERFHGWVVLSIEKNRAGRDKIDLEFMKRFEHGLFDPAGRTVAEQLVDERVFVE